MKKSFYSKQSHRLKSKTGKIISKGAFHRPPGNELLPDKPEWLLDDKLESCIIDYDASQNTLKIHYQYYFNR